MPDYYSARKGAKLRFQLGFFIFVAVEVLRDTTWCISATRFNSRTLASFSYSDMFIAFVRVSVYIAILFHHHICHASGRARNKDTAK